MDKIEMFKKVSGIWFELANANNMVTELDNKLDEAYKVLEKQGIEEEYWTWFHENY